MAVLYASPLYVPKYRSFTAAGIPLAAGKVFIFIAGTSTPFNTFPTFADALAGTNANAHPVILDANGEANIFVPVTDTLIKVVLQDSGGVVQWTEDFLHPGVGYPGYTGTAFVSQWRPLSDVTSAPFIFSNATQFIVQGADVTSTFHPGRRVQTVNTGGVVTSTVSTSSFAVNTTVNLVNDGVGVLDSGLSAVSFGIISSASPAYLDPRTAFTAIKNGNQSSFAASTKLAGWTVQVDSLGEWVAGSNHWLCKYPGIYLINATMDYNNTVGANIQTTLTICNTGGTLLSGNNGRSGAVANQTNFVGTQHLATLIAGATISIYVQGDANTTVLTGIATRLTITRIP